LYAVAPSLVHHSSHPDTAPHSLITSPPRRSSDLTVTITIQGLNDAASIVGDTSGSLTEDSVSAATGTLTVSDVDDDEAHTQAVAAAARNSANGLRSYSADANCHWSYAVDTSLGQH